MMSAVKLDWIAWIRRVVASGGSVPFPPLGSIDAGHGLADGGVLGHEFALGTLMPSLVACFGRLFSFAAGFGFGAGWGGSGEDGIRECKPLLALGWPGFSG
jgi:hypothetical protein